MLHKQNVIFFSSLLFLVGVFSLNNQGKILSLFSVHKHDFLHFWTYILRVKIVK